MRHKKLSDSMKRAWTDPGKRANLLKLCSAGGKSVNRDESYRSMMSAATKGIPKSDEAKRKLSAACTGMKFSESHRQSMSECRKGKPTGPHSPERIWSQRFGLLVRAMTNGGFKQWVKRPRDRRNGGQYKYWRRAVFEKYGRKCFGCGAAPKVLDAHHLLSWENFPALRYEAENGIPLCRDCHKAANAIQQRLESLLWPEHLARPRLVVSTRVQRA